MGVFVSLWSRQSSPITDSARCDRVESKGRGVVSTREVNNHRTFCRANDGEWKKQKLRRDTQGKIGDGLRRGVSCTCVPIPRLLHKVLRVLVMGRLFVSVVPTRQPAPQDSVLQVLGNNWSVGVSAATPAIIIIMNSSNNHSKTTNPLPRYLVLPWYTLTRIDVEYVSSMRQKVLQTQVQTDRQTERPEDKAFRKAALTATTSTNDYVCDCVCVSLETGSEPQAAARASPHVALHRQAVGPRVCRICFLKHTRHSVGCCPSVTTQLPTIEGVVVVAILLLHYSHLAAVS
jgi:hypothetical protein